MKAGRFRKARLPERTLKLTLERVAIVGNLTTHDFDTFPGELTYDRPATDVQGGVLVLRHESRESARELRQIKRHYLLWVRILPREKSQTSSELLEYMIGI